MFLLAALLVAAQPVNVPEPARRARDLDLHSPPVRDFIRLLQDRHTAVDLTLSAFESMMLDRPGQVSVGMAAVADRLPVQVRRGLYAGNLPLGPGDDERFRQSWTKTLQLAGELWRAGVPIEAGTDATPGFSLDRELELDAQAGIPPARVLQLATLGAARIMGMEKDLGLVRAGKLADLALVDGDPTRDISRVRHVALTIKGRRDLRPGGAATGVGDRAASGGGEMTLFRYTPEAGRA
jgi:hypothetical protein